MAKKYLEKDVYEASVERIAYLFNEFDNVLVAFSGGKDSGVCLNLCYDYAKENGLIHKMAMYHLDYEAQCQMTTDYVERTFGEFDIEKYWLCLPVGADCGCRMDAGTWVPWDSDSKEIWTRAMPENAYVINESNCPFEMDNGQQDYEVQELFCEWFEKTYGKTAVVIGIRTDESMNRYRAIAKDSVAKYKDNCFINGRKAYPIYDWNTEDVWTYYGRFEKDYNRLYDLYYQAGLSVEQMRVANPFHSCGEESLRLYKVIDPNNWGRMVSRVNGVNFTAIYGGTTAMGWKSITKPEHFTWKEYCYFLLNTLDEKTRKHYLEKLDTSLKFWKEKGGVLDSRTIDELVSEGAPFTNEGPVNRTSSKDVVRFDDYMDDSDVTDFRSVPTYKRMCVCILKNDYYCKYMGFAQTKNEITKRREAMEKYAKL